MEIKMPLGYTYFVERINIFTYSEKSYSAIMQGNGARLKKESNRPSSTPKEATIMAVQYLHDIWWYGMLLCIAYIETVVVVQCLYLIILCMFKDIAKMCLF